jgi:hypothetical protein
MEATVLDIAIPLTHNLQAIITEKNKVNIRNWRFKISNSGK